jgi:hypothetical protein
VAASRSFLPANSPLASSVRFWYFPAARIYCGVGLALYHQHAEEDSMRKPLFSTLLLAASCGLFAASVADAAKPWELLIPFTRVEAVAGKQYKLTTDHGPWMILASSFAGPGAEKQANQLALELREDFNLESFVHVKTYDFTEPVEGLGLDRYGRPKKMVHANAAKFDEIAVLVGHFESVDDPKLEKVLNKLKHAHPACLDITKNKSTTQRFIGFRELYRKLTPDEDKQSKGPMGNAFVTRNPLLPREYFVPDGLDPLVERMNRDVEYSLLKNPGKYTVKIATFRGATTMQLDQIEQNGKELPSKLEQAAIKANKLTVALRKQGVEAYEFHDRYESVVTVGSFDSVGTQRPDGKTDITPAIFRIINTYGPKRKPIPGQDAYGLVPTAVAGISCDVQPVPVEVPKTSIAAAYAPNNGLFR